MSENTHTDSGERRQANAKRYGSRFKARRRALDLLFEAEARNVDPVALAEERAILARQPQPDVAPVADYTRQIVEGAAVQIDVLDDVITQYLVDDWELERIPATDRAILRVAVWELLFNPEVPQATAVVEATELASQYSGDAASAYINAMLDRVASDCSVLRAQFASPQFTDADEAVDAVLGESVLPENTTGHPTGGDTDNPKTSGDEVSESDQLDSSATS